MRQHREEMTRVMEEERQREEERVRQTSTNMGETWRASAWGCNIVEAHVRMRMFISMLLDRSPRC